VRVWQKLNAKRFDNILLKTRTVGAEARPRLRVKFEGEGAGQGRMYDLVCRRSAAAERQEDRRRPRRAAVGDRGFIPVDVQMRTNVPHIFAIGDVIGNPMLAHRRCTKPCGRRSASAIACALDARDDPQRRLQPIRKSRGPPDRGQAKGAGRRVRRPVRGRFRRAIARARRGPDQAAVRRETHRIVARHSSDDAGDLISEIAPRSNGADAVDIGRTITRTRRWQSIGLSGEVDEGT